MATTRTPARRAAASLLNAACRVSGQPWKNMTGAPAGSPPSQSWTRRPSGSRTSSWPGTDLQRVEPGLQVGDDLAGLLRRGLGAVALLAGGPLGVLRGVEAFTRLAQLGLQVAQPALGLPARVAGRGRRARRPVADLGRGPRARPRVA